METKKILSVVLIILILFEVVMSGYMVYEDQKKSNSDVCFVGSDCGSVQSSSYGSLFGIQLPYYAIVAFLALLLSFLFMKKVYYIGVLVGTLISIFLISVQLFVLKMVCSNCMIVDSAMILILLVSLFYYRSNKR